MVLMKNTYLNNASEVFQWLFKIIIEFGGDEMVEISALCCPGITDNVTQFKQCFPAA